MSYSRNVTFPEFQVQSSVHRDCQAQHCQGGGGEDPLTAARVPRHCRGGADGRAGEAAGDMEGQEGGGHHRHREDGAALRAHPERVQHRDLGAGGLHLSQVRRHRQAAGGVAGAEHEEGPGGRGHGEGHCRSPGEAGDIEEGADGH